MGALGVVVVNPGVQVGLKLIDRSVDFAAEGALVELLQDRLVETLADTVGLRVPGLRLGALDVVDGQVELVVVVLGAPAELRAPVGQHSQDCHALFGEGRQQPGR